MYPLPGEEKRRKVNLGGSSGPSHAVLIEEAKSLRNLRQHQKLQFDSAACLQARWRGILGRRLVQAEMRTIFDRDILGISGLRCLVLLGEDEMLAKWASAVLSGGDGNVIHPSDTSPFLMSLFRPTFLPRSGTVSR